MQRRDLLKSVAAGAGLTILRSGTLRGQGAPSNKLNIALMGCWGRATAHYNVLANENVVALCDVNENRLKEALTIFPKAKTYWDWRKALEQKDIEGVIICTADHHHAFIANWALNRGMNVYCEKPLGICVNEVRTVRANYNKQKAKVSTQHGTQRHAYPNFERVRELILDGAVGDLKTIHGWDARELPRPSYPTGEGEPPSFFHYDQWVGPSPYHPYSPQYFAAPGAGNNCLSWNMYRDFGVGQMGDMGAHTMDLLWNAIDAGAPTAIEADMDISDKFNPDVTPVKLKVTFDHPANSWRGPVQVVWYQGGLKPTPPKSYVDLTWVGNGAIFTGTKGTIFCDFTSRVIIPNDDDGDLTYYKRRTKDQLLPLIGGTGQLSGGGGRGGAGRGGAGAAGGRGAAGGAMAAAGRGGAPGAPGAGGFPGGPGGAPGAAGGRGAAGAAGGRGGGMQGAQIGPDGFPIVTLLADGVPPEMGSPNTAVQQAAARLAQETSGPVQVTGEHLFQDNWLDACKGKSNGLVNGTSVKTHCDFNYAGDMMEQMLLGLVAHRAGKKLEYDPATGRVTNMAEANDWLKREYRPGWTLNG
jgi:predicted dehydrogenase